jgi:hypothetical protein
VLLTFTRQARFLDGGTSGAHDRESCPEPLRTVEIATPGQPALAPYQPRSATTSLHKTRPTGLLVRIECQPLLDTRLTTTGWAGRPQRAALAISALTLKRQRVEVKVQQLRRRPLSSDDAVSALTCLSDMH